MSLDANNDCYEASAEEHTADVLLPQADFQIWAGGKHFFEAPHDPFCFECGDGDEAMIGCQTCARCYHTECMFPPLEPSQVPDIWFCAVCVARNWHVPPIMTQGPPSTMAGISRSSTPLQSGNTDDAEQQSNTSATNVTSSSKSNPGSSVKSSGIPDNPTRSWKATQTWKDAQRWKENSQYSPRGYLLDPSSTDRFIPLRGDGPTIPLNTVIQYRPELSNEVCSIEESARHPQNRPATHSSITSTSQSKQRRTVKVAGNKSPPRKRYKYSDIPVDVENALDLIRSHLNNVSEARKPQVDVGDKAQVLKQKIKIQEGEMLICRQELQAMKQKLSIELSNIEIVRAENADLRKELQELRVVAQKKEDQMKNWQNMLRAVAGAEIGIAI